MEDIKLLEKCPKCGTPLTLIESIRCDPPGRKTSMDGQLFLVKRCLNCGGYPCEEVVEIYEKDEVEIMADKILDNFLNACDFKSKFGVRANKIKTKDIKLGVGYCWFGKQKFIEFALLKWTIDIGILQKWQCKI